MSEYKQEIRRVSVYMKQKERVRMICRLYGLSESEVMERVMDEYMANHYTELNAKYDKIFRETMGK